MKSILLSIKPEWVAKILNREKTIEIRKKFPKDYRGWVYIYCTKDKIMNWYNGCLPIGKRKVDNNELRLERLKGKELNGKVVARFWCDKVLPNTYTNCLVGSCLTYEQVREYTKDKPFVGIPISKLEVFDKPKELREFYKYCVLSELSKGVLSPQTIGLEVKTAPQNYCYVVGDKR